MRLNLCAPLRKLSVLGGVDFQSRKLNRKVRKNCKETQESMTAEDSNLQKPALAARRILLKSSGEALMGEQNYGIDVDVARMVGEELKAVHELGGQVAVVVGGGNIFRGVSKSGANMDRSAADYI